MLNDESQTLIIREVLRQLGDMLANVNDLAIRQNRAKLLEVQPNLWQVNNLNDSLLLKHSITFNFA